MTPEGKVKRQVKELLNKYNAMHFMPVSNGMGRMGVSDIIVCYKGRYCAIETKAGKGQATSLQIKFMDDVIRAGGKAFIVNEKPETLERVENWLRSVI